MLWAMAMLDPKLRLHGVANSCNFLLLVCSLLSCSHGKPCKCPDFDQDLLGNQTVSDTFDQIPGHLIHMNSSTVYGVWDGLGSYMETHNPMFPLTDNCWFILSSSISLWETNYDGTRLYEASFSFIFTFSIYTPENQTQGSSSLVFAIRPDNSIIASLPPTGIYLNQSNTISRSLNPKIRVSAQISIINERIFFERRHASSILVQIRLDSLGVSPVENKYSMRIDYDHVGHHIYAYIDVGEGTPDPDNAIAERFLNISSIMWPESSLGFYSSIGQLLRLHTWTSTVTTLPQVPTPGSGSQGNKAIILSSVLGSAAATAITAAVGYFYFTSKYRRWKKEQDKLARAMQQLPGVPTQIDYSDIRKATKNFHETMKLGKGGFGAVYRCTLPAAASRTGQAMQVAVKKFMREVEDQRYHNFLAEVSIINRLRHKNIVPLVGWSYNKGEPLLIYEYMTNGSLDQHLFGRGSKGNKRHEEEATRHWDTRYGIARDIATGLHYVHHEHEPMVLHRDIKASNIMLDSNFGARLGDFGIACTVAVDRSSVSGVAGTIGYIAPDYAISQRATRQSDIYAFGVLILEIVTGKKSGNVSPEDGHITDWVWRLRQEGKLLEAVDSSVVATDDRQQDVAAEAKRLLLLGLACTNPNPSDRPSMAEVVQVITKLAPTPEVPLERPTFVWPPEDWRTRNSMYSTAMMSDWGRSSATSTVELVQFSPNQPLSITTTGGQSSDSRAASLSMERAVA